MSKPEAISVYAISDLHLFSEGGVRGSLAGGLLYEAVPAGLVRSWKRRIADDAWVLVPGDISDSSPQGGMDADYKLLDGLPGRKLLSPGNHDQGPWRSQTAIEHFCRSFTTLIPLASGELTRLALDGCPGLVVAALIGACAPADSWFGGEINFLGDRSPIRRFERELARLESVLGRAEEVRQPGDRLLVQIHYPPFVDLAEAGPFSARIEAAGVDICIYGHLHQESESGFQGIRHGVHYRIVAAPRLGMRPLPLGRLTERGFEIGIGDA